MRAVLALAMLAGCGRLEFDVVDDASGSRVDAARATCGPAYQPIAGLPSRYRTSMTNSMWLAAEGDCESDGGHLLVPETAEENAYLATVAAGTNEGFTWVGASDHLREGTFLAVDGRGVAPFSHWPGDLEPNNFDRREDCVQVDYAGYWNDCACDYFLAYVCECDFVLPATPSYCDTFATTSCGECSTPCATGTTCQSDQVCR